MADEDGCSPPLRSLLERRGDWLSTGRCDPILGILSNFEIQLLRSRLNDDFGFGQARFDDFRTFVGQFQRNYIGRSIMRVGET